MTVETSQRVKELVAQLHQNNFIDNVTKKWFSQTQDPPRVPIFYTLTKIHKPNPVGRPIISGCEGPTERLSFFVDKLLQPIAQKQKSYLKDTTDFVNFIEKTKVSQDTILVSMDVAKACTKIYHRKRESQQYAEHTRHSTTITLLYRHTTSKKCLNLSFRKIHSNLLETIIFRPMALQWVQKWPLHLQTFLWPILRQK